MPQLAVGILIADLDDPPTGRRKLPGLRVGIDGGVASVRRGSFRLFVGFGERLVQRPRDLLDVSQVIPSGGSAQVAYDLLPDFDPKVPIVVAAALHPQARGTGTLEPL